MSDSQRVMIRGHEAIIRDDPPTQTHNEYPKHMVHPGFQPGGIGAEITSPHGFKYHAPGTSIRFPPVLVMNADQEEYQASQGYRVQGKSDPAAFARAVREMPVPVQDRIEYPKWVGGVLCNSLEEEVAAAEKRRSQLGIVPAPTEEAAEYEDDETDLPEPKTADQLRIEALEAQLAETNANMAKLLALLQPPATASTEPAALSEDVPKSVAVKSSLTHGQKIAAGRARKAAERAAQQVSSEDQPSDDKAA